MRKTLLLLALFFCINSYAQNVPPFINYQVVIRDASGAPIAAGSTVALNIKIFNDGTVAVQAYEEDHNVTIPPAFVVNLRIGGGIPKIPFNNFSAIQWNLGKATYEVTMNGNTVSARGGFATVPYAFNAGGGSSTNYSGSANISITGNVLDLTNKLTGTISVGSNTFPNSKVPVFTADDKGRLMSAGEYPVNMGGDIFGKLDSQFVGKLRGAPLSTVFPINGQVLQFNGISWTPASLSGSGPWTYTPNLIYPSNTPLSDKVAIGSSTATSLLDVKNTALSPYTTGAVASFINSNPSYNSTGVVSISNQAGGGAALLLQNNNSAVGSEGMVVSLANAANGSDGIRSTNFGAGRAGNFINSNATSTVETLLATANANAPAIRGSNLSVGNSSMAVGIIGKTQNTNPNAAGVVGENTGGGFGVIGTTSAGVSGVAGINLSTGNTPNAIGVYGLSSSTSTNSSGMLGESKGSGSGVYGVNSYTNLVAGGVSGVYGTVVNGANVNSGVFGDGGGAANGVKGVSQTGISVYGLKGSSNTGNAGRFDNFNSFNNFDALYSSTNGSLAAIRAISTGPGATLALHVDNGHIKSTSSTAPSFSAGGFNLFATPAFTNPSVSGSDVKGLVSVSFMHSSGLIGSGAYFEFGVTFNKSYSAIPIVVVAPTTDIQGMQFKLQAVSTGGFLIRIYKSNNAGLNDPASIPSGITYAFNYIVIE